MTRRSTVRDWVMAQPTGAYFTTSEVPGTSAAVDSLLSRLARPEGPIRRVRQGVYWRQPAPTRFGSSRPDPARVAIVAAGPGAGLAGASAANSLGLSTQVPRHPHIAVVGRAPKGLEGVKLTARSNPLRVLLTPTEVAVLEGLRDFDRHSEIAWPQARARLQRLASTGQIDLAKIADVAAHERRAGLTNRIADLVSS